jgi:predicted DNA-binding transcriptional regulator AlpA
MPREPRRKCHAEHHAELLAGLVNQRHDGTTQLESTMPRRMLTEQQVLAIVPFGRTSLYHMVKRGAFPRPIFASANKKFWFGDDIIRWQQALREGDHYDPRRKRVGGRPPRTSVVKGA